MATVDDAIRDAYKARAERLDDLVARAADLAALAPSPEVELLLAELVARLAAEVQ